MKRIKPKKTAPKTRMRITNAAKHLGVSRRSIYNMIADGRLKTELLDGATYVKFKKEKEDVD